MRFDCIYKYTCDFNRGLTVFINIPVILRGLTVFINIHVILMRFDFIYKYTCDFNEV